MRVIAGRLKGRTFGSPHSNRTHPMGDRIRGALFNTLGDIEGLTVLDAFAGTGALSFEAVSRGAASALAIEIDGPAQKSITEAVKKLGLDGSVKLVRANCSGWSDNNLDLRFELVLAAPPYDDLQSAVVAKLTCHVADGGLFVLDWPSKEAAPALEGLAIVAQKRFGEAQIVFYR